MDFGLIFKVLPAVVAYTAPYITKYVNEGMGATKKRLPRKLRKPFTAVVGAIASGLVATAADAVGLPVDVVLSTAAGAVAGHAASSGYTVGQDSK